MRVGDLLTGIRHHDDCCCGCRQIEGLEGRLIEVEPLVDVVVAEFGLPDGRYVKRSYSYAVLKLAQA